MKTKLLILSGIVLALSSCSNDILTGGGEVNDPTVSESSGLQTASFSVSKSLQTRVTSFNKWSDDHTAEWKSNLDFALPSEYTEIEIAYDNVAKIRSGATYYVPADFSGILEFDNFDGDLYVAGKVEDVSGNITRMNLYIFEGGSWNASIGGNGNIIYNKGSLVLPYYDPVQSNKITTIFNSGELIIGTDNQGGGTVQTAIYSTDNGYIEFRGGDIQYKGDGEIYTSVSVTGGNVELQPQNEKYICALNVNGNLIIPSAKDVYVSSITAKNLEFKGGHLYLLPKAFINIEGSISMEDNGFCHFTGHEGSTALVSAGSFTFANNNGFDLSFTDNVYINVPAEGNVITDSYNGYFTGSVADYLEQKVSDNTKGRINTANSDEFNSSCGGLNEGNNDNSGNEDPDDEETVPRLVPVGSIEAPHDHNADKTVGNRLLSATCIDYDGETFYVSYHMRGGNYAGDTYDKDGVEGCIETWKFDKDDEDEEKTILRLGQYMWTNEFDFNHLIIDEKEDGTKEIITVGHKGGVKTVEDEAKKNISMGAIIARLPDTFKNFNASEGDYSDELKYKYLTTEVPVMGDGKNGQIKVDYENAGDGNCVIRVGDEYFVATYAGYGKINVADFSRVKDDEGNVAFVSTPGSAKHIIANGDNISVLYLDSRPETTATAQSTATVATVSKSAFPFDASTSSLASYVQPIDGKNVLASDGTNLYACLGKGGLNINNEIITFGEEDKEPVNGVTYDEKYIYVACGSHLRVLDKSNPHAEKAKYHIPNMSANYIKVVDYNKEKYIVVAFGQEGVRVFRLEE